MLTFAIPHSRLVAAHEVGSLLDEKMTDEERADLEDAEEVVKRFLQWDINEADDVRAKLKEVLNRGADE